MYIDWPTFQGEKWRRRRWRETPPQLPMPSQWEARSSSWSRRWNSANNRHNLKTIDLPIFKFDLTYEVQRLIWALRSDLTNNKNLFKNWIKNLLKEHFINKHRYIIIVSLIQTGLLCLSVCLTVYLCLPLLIFSPIYIKECNRLQVRWQSFWSPSKTTNFSIQVKGSQLSLCFMSHSILFLH